MRLTRLSANQAGHSAPVCRKAKELNQWAEVHAELRNKIRWAIRTAALRAGREIPYSEATELASQIATGITEEWRAILATASSAETDGRTRTRSRLKRVESTKQYRLANS